MNIKLQLDKILTALEGAECLAERALVIERIASLEHAGPQDLAIVLDRGDNSVFDAVSKEKIEQCKAGAILASSPIVPNKPYILVGDVLDAFEKIIYTAQQQPTDKAQIDPTATVDAHAVVANGATVGAHAQLHAHTFVGKHAIIGKGVILAPGAKVLDGCTVGDGSIIHAGAIIGSDGFGYQVNATGMRKIPQIGNVHIGKGVEIGANCTIDRGSFNSTVIGDGVKLDNLVHIAHNVHIGPCTAILALTGIAGSAKIGAGCQIGGQVAIKNDITIGNKVKIVSKSAVLKDVADGQTIAGIPAIPFLTWKRLNVFVSRLPELFKQAQTISSALQTEKKPGFLKKFFGFLTR
ncbi:MAG: UDP-3-O-(3-hydroxymyristoyl)glucosamine N-acyltransferase [Epsilonproteobacteria bacterium]|nr:UDP-3-O-(3-hydroxymyristoyl)glucosamine N-acyltransferase [Campylobacterota bacterium]